MLSEQEKELIRLHELGIISDETLEEVLPKAKAYRKLDIYVNKTGELCIMFAYRQQKWSIRIPLMYDAWDYLRERYPITVSKQGRKNKALWKMLSENKAKLNKLDRERKEKFLK